jgi:hypothetical protein
LARELAGLGASAELQRLAREAPAAPLPSIAFDGHVTE